MSSHLKNTKALPVIAASRPGLCFKNPLEILGWPPSTCMQRRGSLEVLPSGSFFFFFFFWLPHGIWRSQARDQI